MTPLTTPYFGRVVRGDINALRGLAPTSRSNNLPKGGPKALQRGPMTPGLSIAAFQYFQYDFLGFIDLRECSRGFGRGAGLDAIRDGAGLK